MWKHFNFIFLESWSSLSIFNHTYIFTSNKNFYLYKDLYYLSKVWYYYWVRRYDRLQWYGLACLKFYLTTLSIVINTTWRKLLCSHLLQQNLNINTHLLQKYKNPSLLFINFLRYLLLENFIDLSAWVVC